MVSQILIGLLIITCSIAITAGFVELAVSGLKNVGEWLSVGRMNLKRTITLTVVTLWLLAASGIAVSLWTAAFMLLDIFQDPEVALYFSIVSFTTLGFGDIILDQQWRLLSGMAAANGLILFGLNTAILLQVMLRVRHRQLDPLF